MQVANEQESANKRNRLKQKEMLKIQSDVVKVVPAGCDDRFDDPYDKPENPRN